MSNKGSFLRNAFIYGLGGVAAQLVSALLLPLYTHYLTPADYGILDILERTGQIVTLLLLGNGIQMATFSFYCQAKTDEERQQTFASIGVVVWGILGAGLACGFLLAPLLAGWLGIDNPGLVLLGIAVVLLQGAVALPMAMMQARVDSIGFVTVNMFSAIARMAAIIVAVAVLGLGVWGVLGATALVGGVVSAFLTIREAARGFPRPDRKIAGAVVRFALPLLPAGIFGLMLNGADRFFLLGYAGPEDVGTYSLGSRLAVMIPMLATMPLWKVWAAKLYDYFDAADASQVVGRVVMRILAIRVFIGLGVCLFSAEIVRVIAPAAYGPASLVIPVLTVASTLQFAGNLFEGSFWARRQTKWKPFINALAAAVAAGTMFVLVPRFGSLGAAGALAVAYASNAVVTFCITQHIVYVTYDRYACFVALSTAVAIYLAGLWLGEGLLGITGKSILWISWPVLLWQLDILTQDEIAWGTWQLTRVRRKARSLFALRCS